MKMTITLFSCLMASLTLLSFVPKTDMTIISAKNLKQNYAEVPSGTVFIEGNSLAVKTFYMSKTEVTNYAYNQFIQDVAASGNSALLARIQMDNQKWETVCHAKPLVTTYATNASYSNYPAVNISYEGAIEYCKWLTDKANKESNYGKVYEFRLPSREEWVRAAEGSLTGIDYAWGGSYVRNAKGCDLCQYNNATEATPVYDLKTYTCKADAYFPNTIGLYNMNGNVAEMISEKGVAVGGSWASKEGDVKNLSTMQYHEPSPLIGFRPMVIINNG